MKKGLLLSAACCTSFAIIFSSCGPPMRGKQVTQQRPETAFHAIEVDAAVSCNITVQPGAAASVQLSGPDNYCKMIETSVKDSTLHIENSDEFRIDWNDQVTANITVPSLDMIDLSGAGNTNISGPVTGSAFNAELSGVGKLVINDINVDTLVADVSGAGNMKLLSGTIKYVKYELSGTGSIDAFGVQHVVAEADVSGAGSINLTVQQKLTTSISGVGSIHYKGHPELTSDNSGIGKVKDAN